MPAIIVENPFATSLAEAGRMIAAMSGKLLTINWPGAWFPCHLTTKRLINKGALGEVTWVHYRGGNSGPLCHQADMVETAPTLEVDEQSITVVR